MLQRLYVHNFRCLENFELKLKDISSALLIGKNGSGKSTIGAALEVFQSIGRGVNRVGDLVKLQDFTFGLAHFPKPIRSQVPMRLEVEVLLDQQLYKYELAFLALSDNGLVVLKESLRVDEQVFYTRASAEVSLESRPEQSKFMLDQHLIALSIIQESHDDPLRIFKIWLANMLILAPVPQLMSGESHEETLQPMRNVANFGDWLSGLLSRYPAAYGDIDTYLRNMFPDIDGFENEIISKKTRNVIVHFRHKATALRFNFDFARLSDGEKCFFLYAVVLASNDYNQPLFCFWDEPDNYVSLSEVGHFISELQSSFKNRGQILLTSHHEETISRFFDDSTFMLDRKSHFEPTLIRRLDEIQVTGDLIDSLICGNIQL